MVNPWKVRLEAVPELLAIEPPDIVTVPELGVKLIPELRVNAPPPFPAIKLAVGLVTGVPAIVSPLKVKVPEFAIVQPVPVMVITLGEEAVNVPEATVKAPPIEKLVEVVVVPLELSPEKVKLLAVTLLLVIEPVIYIVLEGVNTAPFATVKLELMVKSVLG